jgi:hypothetical protein
MVWKLVYRAAKMDRSAMAADAVHKDYMRQVRGKGEVNEPWGTYDSASSKSDSESEFSEPELSSERLSKSCRHEQYEKQCARSESK